MKKRIIAIATCCLMTVSFTVGAYAASNLQSIQAYLNKGVTVKYNGVEQSMTDANGNRVYPITYNGTTYLPARSVSKMLGVDVTWDGTNNTVGLGTYNTGAKDLIEDIGAFYGDHYEYKVGEGKYLEVMGTYINHYVNPNGFGSGVYYNLDGKYSTLRFKAYFDGSYGPYSFGVYGDDNVLLMEKNLPGLTPTEYTVNISGIKKLELNSGGTAFYDITVE